MEPSAMFGAFLLILSYLSGTADAYSLYRWQRCHANSEDLNETVFADSFFYNGIEFLVFNSTVGKYVGYTQFGEETAKSWNSNERILKNEQNAAKEYCNPLADFFKTHMDKTISEPVVSLSLASSSSGSHPDMLVCSAYNFYPRLIRVTWYRDGQKVTSDVSATEELGDGDWFYQIHSHLEFTPTAGEQISCVVEHISFKEPREFVWDPSMPDAERNKVAIGSAALVLGLLVCAAGLLYYRNRSQGWILVPPR